MLYDALEDPAAGSPDDLLAAYLSELAAAVESAGPAAVVDATDLDRATVERLERGDVAGSELTLDTAAAVLSVVDGAPPADAIAAEMRDHLLMGMTTGVVDVDTLASGIDADLTGTEVQQSLEGRRETTLEELAALHRFIAGRKER